MRRLILFTFGIAILSLIGPPVFLSFYLPEKVQNQIVKNLGHAGFEHIEIGHMEKKLGSINISDIKLDKAGFSSIQSIKADYSWKGAFGGQFIHKLTIDSPNLTGELNESGSISVAGLSPDKDNIANSFSSVRTIYIQNGTLDIFLGSLGGANIKYDAQIRTTRNGSLDFKGKIEAVQRQFSGSGKIKGNLNPSGNWQASIEIEQGKIDLPLLKASRVSGLSELSGQSFADFDMVTQLTAGGVSLLNLPWHNVSATVSGDLSDFTVFAEGKSVGQEGVEFTANLVHESALKEYSGSIHADKFFNLFHYLQKNNLISKQIHYPHLMENLSGISFDFQGAPKKPSTRLSYKIQDEEKTINIKGDVDINHEQKTATGNISMPSALIPGPPSGNIFLNGEFKTDYSGINSKTDGHLDLSIKDSSFSLGSANIKGIGGSIHIDDLTALSSKKPQELSFRLPLKPDIKQNGKALIAIENGKAVLINKASLKIFDGSMDTKDIKTETESTTQDFVLTLSDMDLTSAGNHMKINGLSLYGRTKGTIPVSVKENSISIKNGILKSAGPGIIRFLPEKIPSFLQGEDLQLETTRLALENYHYDSFEITMNGATEESMKIQISAKGKNPDLFEGRPFALNLNIESPTAPLFENLLAPETP